MAHCIWCQAVQFGTSRSWKVKGHTTPHTVSCLWSCGRGLQ